jgi:hypothetical protein
MGPHLPGWARQFAPLSYAAKRKAAVAPNHMPPIPKG